MINSRRKSTFPSTNRRLRTETLEDRLLLTGSVEPVIEIEGEVATIIGQATDDIVELTLDRDLHTLNFAGHQYSFDANATKELRIAGGFGANTIRIIGSELNDTVKLIGKRGTVTTPLYRVETFQFDETRIEGGGGADVVEIYGSVEDDVVQALPGDVVLESASSTLAAKDFEEVRLFGRGGNDLAELYGSDMNDWMESVGNYVKLITPNFEMRATDFDRVNGYGRGGLNDRAVLLDSPGDDFFYSTSNVAALGTSDRLTHTKGFEFVEARASDGYDRAVFNGTPASQDLFMAAMGEAAITNRYSYQHKAIGFDRHTANASGEDEAQLFGWEDDYTVSQDAGIIELTGQNRFDELLGFTENVALPDRPIDVVVVLDRSYSMAYAYDESSSHFHIPASAPEGWYAGDPAPPEARWRDALVALNIFLARLEETPKDERVAIVTYNDQVALDLDFTSNYAEVADSLAIYTENFNAGGTNIGGGILEAVGVHLASDRDAAQAIVLLTDGIYNSGPNPIDAANIAAGEGISIDTITFADEANQQDIFEIAEIGEGKYFHADDDEDLNDVFHDIADSFPTLLISPT